MVRYITLIGLFLSVALNAHAHFMWLEFPNEPKTTVHLRFSEVPQESTPEGMQQKAAPMKVVGTDKAEIAMKPGKGALEGTVAADAKLVSGSIVYGVLDRGTEGPFLLKYYAKGARSVADAKEIVGLPVEAVAEIVDGKVVFTVLLDGKPVKGAEVFATLPGEKEEVDAFSDDAGKASFAVKGSGWVGVRAMVRGEAKGELEGKAYGFDKSYTTLTVFVP